MPDQVRDIPIIYSAPMIRALIDDRKTQTRRLAWRPTKPTPAFPEGTMRATLWQNVRPGDRLWVRENIRLVSQGPGHTIGITYVADGSMGNVHFYEVREHKVKRIGITPCIHMPRWASRLTLIVTAVKREPLDTIREEDAMAEGAAPILVPPDGGSAPHVEGFRELWCSLHGAESWSSQEVVAVSFRVIKCNIDNEQEKSHG